jgi:hypothetical protein
LKWWDFLIIHGDPITSHVLRKGRQESRVTFFFFKWRWDESAGDRLKIEEEARNQGVQVVSRDWKRQKAGSPLEPPEGAQGCPHLDFSPMKLS